LQGCFLAKETITKSLMTIFSSLYPSISYKYDQVIIKILDKNEN